MIQPPIHPAVEAMLKRHAENAPQLGFGPDHFFFPMGKKSQKGNPHGTKMGKAGAAHSPKGRGHGRARRKDSAM